MSDHAYPDDTVAPRPAAGLHEPLVPPDVTRYAEASPSLQDSARDSYVGALSTPDVHADRPFLTPGASEEKITGGGLVSRASSPRRRWPFFALAGLIAVIIIVLAVALPVTLVKKHNNNDSASGASSSGGGAAAASPSSNPESPTGAVTGGNGTVIQAEDGSTFMYINEFGGYCKWSIHHFHLPKR